MAQIVNADTGEPVDAGYVDGYLFADRLLEGVMFEITLDDNGEPQCNGVVESDREYCDRFSDDQMSEWCRDALDYIDTMTTLDGGTDLFLEEADADAA